MRRVTTRERNLLIALGTVVISLFIYLIIISPYLEYQETSESGIKENMAKLRKMEKMYTEYREIKQKITSVKATLNKKRDNITSQIEQWANSSNIAGNIAYTRRKQTTLKNKYIRITTDIKFNGVSIEKLLKFVYEVENSNQLLKINYIRIHQGLKSTNTYDVILKIDSFTKQ